ncbi:hypothetical protein L6452_12258 [Arctium lappa]|uniref:Uncharacterized protein n=1 Tax=Arctium lappa TaxID=4217 RepID=A0ACB9DQN8_ARCLA|nr:hypothetical protein L6452_12258 [Arctium lappa]
MTPPDMTTRCPYDFFNKCHPKLVDLDGLSEELPLKRPDALKDYLSQALLQAAEVLVPTVPAALTDSALLAITCQVSGHKTWVLKVTSQYPIDHPNRLTNVPMNLMQHSLTLPD